ncbi:DUF5658 family protein [Halopelagius fulvigenes]|uniref:DUF5658 family protein n=1 Tax=Halopelagius fulvigenes TaxID=1198324 RepID=A0ABD5TY78_9EURY
MAAPNSTASPSSSAFAATLDAVADYERTLWALVGVTFVLDVLLTAYGLELGYTEGNPFARAVISAVGPLPAMVGLKALVVGFAVVAARLVPNRGRPLIPLAVATPWGLASVSNFVLVVG